MFSLTPGEQFYAYASINQAGGEMRELTYVPLPVKPSSSFRMYRFTPTRMRSSSATAVHISELKFRQQGPPGSIINTRRAVASNPGGQNPASHGPEMAVDGKHETKWLDLNKGALVVEFPRALYKSVVLDEFCFTTGNDCEDRDPVQWRLDGSMTGAEWTPLHVQSHYFDTPRERRAQTPWFPFNTSDTVQEEETVPGSDEDTMPCLVTRATFEAQLRGVTSLSWQDFCAAIAPGPDFADRTLPGSHLLGILISLSAFSLNLLIWCQLTMLGTHHSPILGLVATLVYGFTLRTLLASGVTLGNRPAPSIGATALGRPWPWARRRKGLKQD
uniref:F5/8 type C domain-containing protein n=1 Tax=Alexandrium andersonii TaxID=327968 RepID=A0A7S2CII6_9DINO